MRRKLLAAFFLCAALASAQDRVVTVLSLGTTIDPVSARYVERGLARAEREGAVLAVIELDTPGGLGSAMEQVVSRILASKVPVAVYVSPPGGRAASAGVFVAMAAHVAAMAPGTRIGAAHPVQAGGSDIEGAMGDKVLNDTVAGLRTLADLRGRDPSWAEDAVRRSVSLTETEALARRVVDLVTPSLGSLLAAVDGRTVTVGGGPVTLHTAAAEVRRVPVTIVDRILGWLVNPDLAYVLLVLGILAILVELTVPGIGVPGVAGSIALLLSFVAFGNLPTNVGGIGFILLAVILFIVDIKAPTHGILTAGGVAAFLLGSLLLFPPWRGTTPVTPAAAPFTVDVHVSVGLIAAMTVLVTAFFVFILAKGIRAQSLRVSAGAESVTGMEGVAVTDLAPGGIVRVGGETWSAVSAEGPLTAGETVRVVGREGLRVIVRRSQSQGGAS